MKWQGGIFLADNFQRPKFRCIPSNYLRATAVKKIYSKKRLEFQPYALTLDYLHGAFFGSCLELDSPRSHYNKEHSGRSANLLTFGSKFPVFQKPTLKASNTIRSMHDLTTNMIKYVIVKDINADIVLLLPKI